MDESALTEKIIGCAMKVHRALGSGYLESVYNHALKHELAKSGVAVEKEVPLRVRYDGIDVGCFVADLIAEGRVIIELKAVTTLLPAHEAQLVNYLTTTGIEIGLLVNFGRGSLEFRRKYRTYQPGRIAPLAAS